MCGHYKFVYLPLKGHLDRLSFTKGETMNSIYKHVIRRLGAAALIFSIAGLNVFASSHAEAPLTSMDRYADNTDVYAFRSLEEGRSGFVTILANFIPFQDPSGGPHFYRFDDTVLYEIHIDNNGDGNPDVSYQFQFTTEIVNGETVLGMNAVNENGIISSLNDPDYNMPQTYTVRRVDYSSNSSGKSNGIGIVAGRSITTTVASGLRTPPSNIGPRVTPNYEENLGQPAVYGIASNGKVFAGQREEGFFIDVGGVFDALNFRSIGMSGGIQSLQGKNVSTIALEVPIQELTRSRAVPASSTAADAVIGIYSTASRRSTRVINPSQTVNAGPYRQVSRLGNPLVNEVVVPLNTKDAFNASKPTSDAALVPAVLDPELARLINLVFGIPVPPAPRTDLAQIFALGIPVNAVTGPNYTTVIQGTTSPHEYLRLNLGIPITPIASINRLGILGGDAAGFPNGRRPQDDVVDIALRAMAGGTPFTPPTNVPPNNTLGDGVSQNEVSFLTRFPYLASPYQGNQPNTSNFPAP